MDEFLTNFFRVGERTDLVSEPQRHYLVAVASGASAKATADCTDAFSTTDFRADLEAVDVPALIIHGDHDVIVPFEVSGRRTAEMINDSKLVVVPDAPHGFNLTHAAVFNAELLAFPPQLTPRSPRMGAHRGGSNHQLRSELNVLVDVLRIAGRLVEEQCRRGPAEQVPRLADRA